MLPVEVTSPATLIALSAIIDTVPLFIKSSSIDTVSEKLIFPAEIVRFL